MGETSATKNVYMIFGGRKLENDGNHKENIEKSKIFIFVYFIVDGQRVIWTCF